MSHLELVIQAASKDLGDNFVVRRSLPYRRRRLVGPFIFWDHMGPVTLGLGKEMLVRSHPHIGLATITYLFSGEILHRDSLGNELFIKPGEVNWMTAGSGITHSERSQPQEGTLELEGIQLWVALPKESQNVDASFVHHKAHELPQFKREGVDLHLIAGKAFDYESPVPVFSPLFYLNGKSAQSSHFQMSLTSQDQGAVYVTRGQIEMEGQTLERFSMGVFKKGAPLQFNCSSGSEFMILGGQVFPEEPQIWWNFVSHDQETMEEAKRRWANGKFPKTVNETDFIPLPEK